MEVVQFVPLIVVAVVIVLVAVGVRRSVPIASPSEGPSGINGWLLLPAIGVILSPIVQLITIIQSVQLLDDAAFVPGARGVLLSEIAGLTLIALSFVYVAIRFFQRKHDAPKLFIALLLITILFILLDSAVVSSTLSLPFMDASTGAALVRAVIGALIWVPYMLISARVRNTFVVP